MILRSTDLGWLMDSFPQLHYDANNKQIRGELIVCAAYDIRSGRMHIGEDDACRQFNSFLCDSFSVRIELDPVDVNGWPKVYETSGRYAAIAAKQGIEIIDLHFYSDGACCLGINFAPHRDWTIKRFMDELVLPFFYRLAYTDKYGLSAARNDLWGEYSHGEQGFQEYVKEISDLASKSLGRNKLCPCGSGQKYKRCHQPEAKAIKRIQSGALQPRNRVLNVKI